MADRDQESEIVERLDAVNSNAKVTADYVREYMPLKTLLLGGIMLVMMGGCHHLSQISVKLNRVDRIYNRVEEIENHLKESGEIHIGHVSGWGESYNVRKDKYLLWGNVKIPLEVDGQPVGYVND